MRNLFCAVVCGLLFVVASMFTTTALAVVPSPASISGFQPNIGQSDPRVAFWAERDGITLFVTRDGALVHRFAGSDGRDWVMIERLDGSAALRPAAVGEDVTRITVIGSDETKSAPTTRRIAIGEPWPGIRAELLLNGDEFEKRFELAPGVDAGAIRIALDGVEGMRVADDGQLVLGTGPGDVMMSAPIAWQDIKGQRIDVPVAYLMADNDSYGFTLGDHNAAYPVTIDPIIRSTFAGTTGSDSFAFMSITSDSVYVAGSSGSNNFPGLAGGYQTNVISNAGFQPNTLVARFSLDLTTLQQSTYYGKFDVVPDSGGVAAGLTLRALSATESGVYIAGIVPGRGDHAPTTPGALQPTSNGGAGAGSNYPNDVFVARLSPDLTTLQAGTYYGTDKDEQINNMIVGSDGVYFSGQSNATALPGNANGAVTSAPTAGVDTYIAKISLDLDAALAATWINAGISDWFSRGITLGDDGSLYVGGSGRGNLIQTAGAYQATRPGTASQDCGFIVHLSADLATHFQSTYLGGSNRDRIENLHFGEGNLYISGNTQSSNDFPMPANAAIPTYTQQSPFVFALSADLTARVGGTYFAGTVDPVTRFTSIGRLASNDGTIYLGGTTRSNTLPGTMGGAQESNAGTGSCGYVAAFNPTLTTLRQASYIACGGFDVLVNDVAFANDTLYLAGTTKRVDLPGSATGAQPMNGGSGNSDDGFILTTSADLGGPRPTSDLAVEKTGSLERIANRYVRFFVTVRNNGPDSAVNAAIGDSLPPEIGATNWQCTAFDGATCPNASGSGSIDETVTIPNGARLEYELCSLVIGGAPEIVNVAEAVVAINTLDPVSSNNSDEAMIVDPRLFSDGFEPTNLPAFCPPPAS